MDPVGIGFKLNQIFPLKNNFYFYTFLTKFLNRLRNMLTLNLLVTTMAIFNSTDVWLRTHLNRDEYIKSALRSRKVNHDSYLDDINTFNCERYWHDLDHQCRDINLKHDLDATENDGAESGGDESSHDEV